MGKRPQVEPLSDDVGPLHQTHVCHVLQHLWGGGPHLLLMREGPPVACDLRVIHRNVLAQAAPLPDDAHHARLGDARHVADVGEAVEHP